MKKIALLAAVSAAALALAACSDSNSDEGPLVEDSAAAPVNDAPVPVATTSDGASDAAAATQPAP